MITCAEAVKQLWAYLDGVVDEPSRAAIDEHLSFCRRCCGEAEFAVELRAFMAAQASEELPGDVRARLSATLERLDAEGAA